MAGGSQVIQLFPLQGLGKPFVLEIGVRGGWDLQHPSSLGHSLLPGARPGNRDGPGSLLSLEGINPPCSGRAVPQEMLGKHQEKRQEPLCTFLALQVG